MVVRSDPVSAEVHYAASWNQHCAPPPEDVSCNSVATPPLPDRFVTPLATWVPSSQTFTPALVEKASTSEWVWRLVSVTPETTVWLAPGNRINRPEPAELSICTIGTLPKVSNVTGAVDAPPGPPCRQFGRDHTSNHVHASAADVRGPTRIAVRRFRSENYAGLTKLRVNSR